MHAVIVEALKTCGALPDAEWLRHMGRDDDSRWCLIVCRDGDLVLSPGPNADRVGSVIRLGDEDSRGIDLVELSRVLDERRTQTLINRLIGALTGDDHDTVVAAETELSKQLSETTIS
jgi:hypothetical protein